MYSTHSQSEINAISWFYSGKPISTNALMNGAVNLANKIYQHSGCSMYGLIQRVSSASVIIEEKVHGQIDQGILLLLGIEKTDSQESADKLLHKVLNYRIFSDANLKMNLSLKDIGGGLLVISQFTLAAETNRGLRPSFSSAATPDQAESLYNYFVTQAKQLHSFVEQGVFAADMQVSLCNDGPVTFNLRV